MKPISRLMLLAVALFAMPTVVVFAQSANNPPNTNGNHSTSAAPGTSAMDSGIKSPGVAAGAAQNSNRPGATGQTVVPGDKSTVAGSEPATDQQQQGTVQGR